MPEKKTPRKSPSKPRVLNRWDDDLDKAVLLCVQYACSEAGLKIPWARVAEIMGPSFTEGGIVQHLAKLRNLMVLAEIPVPPSIKRGTVTKSPSKIYGSAANPRTKLEPIAPLFPNGTSSVKTKQDDGAEPPLSIYERARRANAKLNGTEGEEAEQNQTTMEEPVKEEMNSPVKSAAKPKSKSKAKAKNKGRRNDMSDEEEGDVPDLYDSDSEYSSPKKRRRTVAKPKAKANATKTPDAAPPSPATTPAENTEEDNVVVKVEEEESGPATRTRGVKRDYSLMATPSSDEIEPEDEEQEQVVEAAVAEQEHPVEATIERQEQIDEAMDEHAEHGGETAVEQDSAEEVDDDAAEYEQELDEEVAEEDQELDDATDTEAEGVNSEAETEIADSEAAAAAAVQAQGGIGFPQPPEIFDTPYGQVFGDPQMASAFAHRFHNTSNFNRIDYMNPYIGINQYPYSNIASMNNYMPRHGTFVSSPSMGLGMFTPSTESSQGNSQIGGSNLGYSNLAALPGDNFLNPCAFTNTQSVDIINEQDHVNSRPSGDVFFTQDDDYIVDGN